MRYDDIRAGLLTVLPVAVAHAGAAQPAAPRAPARARRLRAQRRALEGLVDFATRVEARRRVAWSPAPATGATTTCAPSAARPPG
jgi:hypothetical protein